MARCLAYAVPSALCRALAAPFLATLLVLLAADLITLAEPSAAIKAGAGASFKPGQPWLDTEGTQINAHGFCILNHEGKFYWYGSHKIAGLTESQKNEAGVRCYISTDLLNWTNAGLVSSKSAPGMHSEVADAGILDRPKVIFNAATKTFVMYFKLYPPRAAGGSTGTDVAYVGVAVAKEPAGAFEYRGKFVGGGSTNGTGDFAIFQDADGAAYHIAVRKPDKALVCGRLTKDALKPAGEYVVMSGVTHATEAPALFRRAGKIYLLGSASTGWKPNPARIFVADQVAGPYASLGNPCRGVNPNNQLGPEKTFGGQSTFVLPLPGKRDAWIAMFDIWNVEEPINARYIWLPLEFEADQPVIRWRDTWDLSIFKGRDGEAAQAVAREFSPGLVWSDNNVQINAHGGGVVFHGDRYSWEGWVNYGASWCISLAYLKFDGAKTISALEAR